MKLFKYNDYINRFINESLQSKDEIESICKDYGIKNYTINEDGTVDIDGSVNLNSLKLTKLPLNFGKVYGSFIISNNKLTSLEGCPSYVGLNFDCSKNKLMSLHGSPSYVGLNFYCFENGLKSLDGCAKEIGGSIECNYNNLTSLKGGPEKVSSFYCNDNKLTTLEGCPKEVISFDCENNLLTSLKGGPEKVSGNFDCSINILSDVKGLPYIPYDFNIIANPVHSIFELFEYPRWKEVAEFLNEYNVIRDGNKVVMQALELVYDELGLEVPENIEIRGYEII